MKICTATALLVASATLALPFAAAQSSAPSAAEPTESLVPSSAALPESLVPSSLPPATQTIAELVVSDPEFSQLESLLIATGFLGALDGEGPLTLFAPTNDALSAFDLSLGVTAQLLSSIVSYHAVSGEEVVLVDGATATTLQGTDVVLTVTETETKVNDANIEGTTRATNGVVYIIDTVLVPEGIAPTPTATESVPAPLDSSSAPSSVAILDSQVPTIVDTTQPTVPAPSSITTLPEPTLSSVTSTSPSVIADLEIFVPSGAVGIESSTPSETTDTVPAPTPTAFVSENISSSAPSTILQVDSLVPSGEGVLESLTPSLTSDTAPTPEAVLPEAVSSSAPSTILQVDSLVPSGEGALESLAPSLTSDTSQPTDPFLPAIDPQCNAHPECVMISMDGDCCPTPMGEFLECCDLGDMVTSTPETGTADPLDIDEEGPDEEGFVTLTPTNLDGCIKINGKGEDDDNFILAACDKSDPLQQFKFVGNQIQLGMDPSMCLQAVRLGTPSHGKYLRVFPCDSTNDLQDFTWDAPDGRLYPTAYPAVTVVFRGTFPNVNLDPIILGGMNVDGVKKREGWEVYT